MIYLKKQIKKIYKEWNQDPYMYEKDENNVYQATTYKAFIEKSLSIASFFLKKGFRNKTFLLLSENSISLMECDLAISFYVGRSAIACKEWPIEDLEDGVEEIDANCIICSEKYEQIAKQISIDKNIPYYRMDKIPFKFEKEYLELKVKKYTDVCKIVFSSGTTGRSKGVLLSLKNVFSGYESLQRRCHITHDDVAYMFLPLHHTYASICHFMYSLLSGHRLYIASSTTNIGKELLEVNPTIFCTVPLVLYKLQEAYQDNIQMAFGTRIKYIISGGAPIDKSMRILFKEKGLCLMQTYAMTETSSAFTLAYPNQDDLESCGEIYEDIDVRIDHPDKEGIGEIIVKGNNVFLGYTDESLNKIVFDQNGYFHTGDIGWIKNAKLYVIGRKKKMLLTSNGENILASYIEDKIMKLDSSINCVKAYVKNDLIGVNLYVTKENDYQELINQYNENVPRYEKIGFFRVYRDSIDSRLKQ